MTFHFFPKDANLCKKWTVALRRENFKPSATTRLCSEHFKATDFDDDGFRRRLRRGVVPSVFNFPEHLQPKATPCRTRNLIRQQPLPTQTTNKIRSQDARSHVAHDHGGYCTSVDPVVALRKAQEELKSLKKKLRTTKQHLKRKIKTTKQLKGVIKQIRDKGLIEKEAFTKLTAAFGDVQSIMFTHVINATKSKKAEYTDKIRAFAVTLHYLSPKAYAYLQPVLKLPHPATLRTWRSSVYCQPGYLDNMLSLAAKNVTEDDASRMCSLVIDEMSIRKDVSWCQRTHR